MMANEKQTAANLANAKRCIGPESRLDDCVPPWAVPPRAVRNGNIRQGDAAIAVLTRDQANEKAARAQKEVLRIGAPSPPN
jgi:hypothetical protein